MQISSAGISGWHTNEPPHHLSIEVAKDNGIDISDLRSSKVTQYLEADLYIVMDSQNLADMLNLGFPKDKVKKIGDFGFSGKDVVDPYGHDKETFIEVYKMLEVATANLLEYARK